VTLTPPLDLVGALLAAALVLAIAIVPVRSAVTAAIRSVLPQRSPTRGPARSGTSRTWSPPAADRRTRLLAMTLAMAVVGLVLFAAHRADGTGHVEVLDVGQGDAILVEGDHGSRLLVDGGPDPARLLVALDNRLPPWDRRIDVLILSHPHEDHVAGMPRLLERYRVRQIYQPGMLGPGPGYRAFASWLLAHGLPLRTLQKGDTMTLDSIGFLVLWPDPGRVPTNPPDTGTGINNVSIVLLGTLERHRFLLMGDVEEEIDPILLGRGLPRVEVLKVAHHGSRTSSTGPFLDAVQPGIAIASAGAKNPYGHPAPATIQRLRDHGATVYRTDLNGTVDVALEGDRWVAHPDRAAPTPAPGATTSLTAGLFRCAIPDPFLAAAAPIAEPAGLDDDLLYDRPDVRARPSGGGAPAPQPGSPALAPPPLASGRGDRRLARRADRGPWHPGRPIRGRGRGAPPRRRQAAAGRRPGDGPAAWRRLGGLAHPARPP
jgi:competence protein ComEC